MVVVAVVVVAKVAARRSRPRPR